MPHAKGKSRTLPVHRTDLLPSNLTPGKEKKVRDVLIAYRKGAVLLGREQWRLFFDSGSFQRNHDKDKVTFAAVIGNANRVQTCRYQVVGVLQSWMSNRANEFRNTVTRSSLDPVTKHQLYTINRLKAWFSREYLVMKDSGETISDNVRKLARSIMRHVMSRHRRPNLSRISMRLDRRCGAISRPRLADQNGAVSWWVRLSTMDKGRRVDIPLLGYAYHEQREGRTTNGIQINMNRDGRLTFGVVTDLSEAYAESRAAYECNSTIALDFGLSTLFASSEGQLLGQDWLKQLRRYDTRITNIAKGMQKRGHKPRESKRYRDSVVALKGFLRNEVGRILNRLVAEGKPKELILERLDFRNPNLSKRLNRILQNSGRTIIREKLKDLEERPGVASVEVNPAYTSQECSSCGYVDKKNRRDQAHFQCRWCGHSLHADLNASRNIRQRRALSLESAHVGKAAILAGSVRRFQDRAGWFGERRVKRNISAAQPGGRRPTADPRLSNPYFRGMMDVSRSIPETQVT